MNKTDIQLKQDVENELRWDPKINPAQIGVSVDHGAVSLTGAVDTYAEKWAAEDAIKRVAGVRAVAQDLTVKLTGAHKHADPEIAQAALSAFKWDVWVPKSVTVSVRDGSVTLQGEVEWNYQRDAAERAVRYLSGVVHVFNSITLKSGVSASQVKEKVTAALQRQATADAAAIQVATSGGTVTLSGKASSWHEMEDATIAAWGAPGVTSVKNELAISSY